MKFGYVVVLTVFTNSLVSGQTSPTSVPVKHLPAQSAGKFKSDIHYTFTTDYYEFTGSGVFQSKKQVSAFLTEGVHGTDTWNRVSFAQGTSLKSDWGRAIGEPLMEGFSYPHASVAESFKPGFFKQIEGKNELMTLIWDVGQIELFGLSFLDSLEPNKPYLPSLPEAKLPGGGSFHNERVEITWVGTAKVDGQQCAQILYEAPFNPLSLTVNGMKLTGLSYYHGLISVNLKDLRVQRGTIHETVVMSVSPPGVPANFPPIVTQTVRDCVLQRTGR